jgi:hypothetical protein
MKNFSEQLNKIPKIAYLIGGIALVVLASVPIVLFMLMPTFTELGQVNQEIDTQKAKTAEIKQTISFLSTQNKTSLKGYSDFFDQLVPGQLDMLHFASLNEVVAAAAGATVEGISISKGVTPSTGTGATPPPAPTEGSSAPTTTPIVQAAPTKVIVTYISNYDTLLNLIDFWTMADQLVGVTLIKATAQANGVLNYTIEYTLPVAVGDSKATISDRVSFAAGEKEKLDDLRGKIIYFATPSSKPVGKDNPFQ